MSLKGINTEPSSSMFTMPDKTSENLSKNSILGKISIMLAKILNKIFGCEDNLDHTTLEKDIQAILDYNTNNNESAKIGILDHNDPLDDFNIVEPYDGA